MAAAARQSYSGGHKIDTREAASTGRLDRRSAVGSPRTDSGVQSQVPPLLCGGQRWVGAERRRVAAVARRGRAMGCWSVALTGGEVGCRPGWLTIAQHVRDLGMSLTVLTNGTTFSEQDLHDLADLRPSVVSLSLYGSTAGVHEAVTGVPGSFERAIHTMVTLRKLGVRVRASVILMRDNFHDRPRRANLPDRSTVNQCSTTSWCRGRTAIPTSCDRGSTTNRSRRSSGCATASWRRRATASRDTTRWPVSVGRWACAVQAGRRSSCRQVATCCRAWVSNRPSATYDGSGSQRSGRALRPAHTDASWRSRPSNA